jgi:hypothetical protein
MNRRQTAIFLSIVVSVLALEYFGVIRVYAQAPTPAPTIALYVSPHVSAFNTLVPRVSPFQATQAAVNDCSLTTSEKSTKICVTVKAVDVDSTVPVANQYVVLFEMDDFAFQKGQYKSTNAAGFANFKVTKGAEVLFCIHATAPYSTARTVQSHRLSSSQHTLAIWELRKSK